MIRGLGALARGALVAIAVLGGFSGSAFATQDCTFLFNPSISSLSPAGGSTSGGTNLLINGNFPLQPPNAVTTVKIDGIPLNPNYSDASRISVITPAHASGPVVVEVTTTPSVAFGPIVANDPCIPATASYEYALPLLLTAHPPTTSTQVGQPYSQSNAASGGNGGYVYDALGNLPPGLSLNSGTGLVSGTLTSGGSYSYTIRVTDGKQTTAQSTTISTVLPTLTAINPPSGPLGGGQRVVLNGLDLANAISVDFGGTIIPQANLSVTSTSIGLITPPHAAGPVNVLVTTPAGQQAVPATYTYINPPTLDANPAVAISPSSGPIAGGTPVTITGTNFVPGFTTASLGGAPLTGVAVTPTTITGTTSAHAAGSVNVVVTTPGGSVSGANLFTYAAAPTVTAISPPSGATAGGQTVTISGTSFVAPASVTIGGVAATSVTVVNATTITATTGAHAAGLVDVVVTTPFGTGTGSNLYTYAAPPTVTAISPASGPMVGGTPVTISGTDFNNATSVTFDGVAATSVMVVGANTITALAPAHAAGAVNVAVTTPSGTGTGANLYTYAPRPVPLTLTPALGPTTGGQTVIISGQNLTGASSVTLGGTAATIGAVTPTSITVTTPAHAAGAVEVVVTTPSGAATAASLYTFAPPGAGPTVTAISPAGGPLVGGTPVTITGANLTGATTVTIGGLPATGVIVVSATTITAVTPAHAAGAVDVVVTTPNGTGTGTGLFTYSNAPIVTAISPPSGPIAGGTAVTISGQNFTGATSVTIGGAAATIGTVTATTITATTPAHAAGVTDVVVTTPIGVGTGTQIFTFVTPLTMVSTPAPVRQVGQAYAQTNVASGGTPVYSYALTGGALPAGTSLTPSSGLVFGTPTTSGAFSYTITASDSTVPPQTTSRTVTGTISVIGTATTLTSSVNPSLLGQPVTITATITPTAATGSVTFSDGATVLCASVPVANGFATCTTRFMTAGAHPIQAVYSGSAQHGPSTSAVLVQNVNDQRIRTVETIGKFMGRRNDLIMGSAPDGNRQVDRLIEADDSTNGGPAPNGFVGGGTGASSPASAGAPARLGAGPDAADLTRMRFGLRDRPGVPSDTNPFPSEIGSGVLDDPASTGGGSLTAGPLRIAGNSDGSMRYGFATSLRDYNRTVAATQAAKAGEAGAGLSAGHGPVGAARFSPFDLWVEGKYTTFRDNNSSNRAASSIDGHFGLISVGADYVLSRWLLVGVMGQFDIMGQRTHREASAASGRGWMVGPYATLRLTDNLFWQARGAWGQSSNQVSPFQTYTDAFESERWLASTALVGRWDFGGLTFRPSATVAYMEDVAKSYADHFGITIPEVKARLGQARVGPEIGYRYQFSPNLLIEPHIGAHVIWNFAGATVADGIGVISGQTAGPEGVRGRVEIGQRAVTSSGIAVNVSGSYDGIGSKGYEAYSAKAQVHLPLP